MVDKDNKFKTAADRKEVLFMAIGAGSVCWEKPEGAGLFESEKAAEVGEHALARLRELDKPLLGLATTDQLISELVVRFETSVLVASTPQQNAHLVRGLRIMNDLREGLPPNLLNYRTVDS